MPIAFPMRISLPMATQTISHVMLLPVLMFIEEKVIDECACSRPPSKRTNMHQAIDFGLRQNCFMLSQYKQRAEFRQHIVGNRCFVAAPQVEDHCRNDCYTIEELVKEKRAHWNNFYWQEYAQQYNRTHLFC